MESSRVWVLLYSRIGDNNQALALAKSLAMPFGTKQLSYNRLREFGLFIGPSLLTLNSSARAQLGEPWPEVVIAVGRWSVPVARWIKSQSGGRTKIIFLGNPRINPSHFDLVIATADYLGPRGRNVAPALLPVALPANLRKNATTQWFDTLPPPRLLFLVGGPVKYWQLSSDQLDAALSYLIHKAAARNGSVLVSGSPRTPPEALAIIRKRLAGTENGRLAPTQVGGLGGLLETADEIVVTGDSMAMITEAILTGKPVGILPLELSANGWRKLGIEPANETSGSKRRDLRRFWRGLWAQGLAGTIECPRAAHVESSATSAASVAATFLGLRVANEVVQLKPAAATLIGAPGEHWKPRESHRALSFVPSPLRAFVASLLWIAAWLKGLVRKAGTDAGALALTARDPRTPWYVKVIAWTASLTAVSPVDLTPDFIPVVGYLDDLILLVVGTLMVVRLVPPSLWAEMRARAAAGERFATTGAAAVLIVWLSAGTAAAAHLL